MRGKRRWAVLQLIRRQLWQRVGWAPLYEFRNKAMLGHTALPIAWFERTEARRILASFPAGPPRAQVAVILLTYKRPIELVRAIDSVLAQTVQDFVILVVDDGAGLPDLPDDPRLFAVTLRRNINVLGASRNIGMRVTRSRFVAFLDDDNRWRPDHLETTLSRLVASDGPDAVYTAMRRVLPDGTEFDILSRSYDRRAASNECFLDTNAFVAVRQPGLRFSRLRRRPSTMPKEDWEMIYRFGRRHRIEHISVPTVEYALNPASYWTEWSSQQGSTA
jgi:glycosyltransferase involved in cell wall biosynthesis